MYERWAVKAFIAVLRDIQEKWLCVHAQPSLVKTLAYMDKGRQR